LAAGVAKKYFEWMPIFLILRSKIKKMGIHSLFSFAAAGGESLLKQPRTLFK
jgi:hypothetical protein